MARYSVMKREPPPATRLMPPKKPPPPACWVCVVIWTEADIQESSPASEMTASLGPRANSRTGMVVPRMRFCMNFSCVRWGSPTLRKVRKVFQEETLGLDLPLLRGPIPEAHLQIVGGFKGTSLSSATLWNLLGAEELTIWPRQVMARRRRER